MTEVSVTRFKACSLCECIKPASSDFFTKDKCKRDGFSSRCRICHKLYARDHYQRNKTRHNAFTRQWAKDNAERVKEYSRLWYEDNKDHISRRGVKYRQENSERIKASKRRYYEANKEWLYETNLKWKQDNPEKHRAAQRRWQEANASITRERNAERYRENVEQIKARMARYYRENAESIKARNAVWAKANPEKRRNYARKTKAKRLAAPHEPYTELDIVSLWDAQDGSCAYCLILLSSDYHVDHMVPLSRGGADRLDNLCLACPPCNISKGAKTPEEFMYYKAALQSGEGVLGRDL